MRDVTAACVMQVQGFDCVVLTAGGSEMLLDQWKPDVALFKQQRSINRIINII